MEALRAMPATQEEDVVAVLARIRVLLRGARKRDAEKGFENFTLDEEEAFEDFINQSSRCAVTANKLTCVPKKLNSFRCVGLCQ
jgi:hypothetical protein